MGENLMNSHIYKGKYNENFRNMIVELYNSGVPVRTINEEYKVPIVTIYRWIKKFNSASFNKDISSIQQKYADLKKQNLKLKQENEILKQATAIFVRSNQY